MVTHGNAVGLRRGGGTLETEPEGTYAAVIHKFIKQLLSDGRLTIRSGRPF